MSNKIIVGVVILCVALIVWARMSTEDTSRTDASSDSEVITTSGIHWHPELSIRVRGEAMKIPANIGLTDEHNPMHTHDEDGIIHLEFNNVVRKEDLRLGRLFELWGKTFNQNQIFEYSNTDTEQVHMFVNGESNTEYDDYILQPEDKIEIRYE